VIYVDLEVRTFIFAAVSLKKEGGESVSNVLMNTLYAALGIFIFFSGAFKGQHHGYHC